MTARLVSALVLAGPAVVGSRIESPLVTIVGPLLALIAIGEARRRRRRRRAIAEADALPVLVERLIQQLRSGASLLQACRQADEPLLMTGRSRSVTANGPGSAGPLGSLIDAIDGGETLAEASRHLGSTADPSLRLLAMTLEVLADNGGPAVPALQRLRHTLVGRAHRRHRAEAQAAGAVASAALLALAPALFALVLAGLEPDLANYYLHETGGLACAAVSIGLSSAGWWWMQRSLDHHVAVE
ncbi:MAG: hypothetical protein AAGA93_21270 [Actinomycetota bacterium]